MRHIEIVDMERRNNIVYVHCKVRENVDNIQIEENEPYKSVEDAILGSTEKLINKV
jgi:hypothetical protein